MFLLDKIVPEAWSERIRFRHYKPYIEYLIQKGVFPGINVLVATDHKPVIRENFGHFGIGEYEKPLSRDALYDIASLTKPLFTAFAAMSGVERGLFQLDDPVLRYFSEFPNSEITIKHLLLHTSGLPSWYPLYLESSDPITTIASLKRSGKAGGQVNYSCLGYILLCKILERVFGLSFDQIIESLVIRPLNLKRTFVGAVPETENPFRVPTEKGNGYERETAGKLFGDDLAKIDGYPWRAHMLIGEINDGNAHFLKGNAGNAGLFSTAEDLLSLSAQFYESRSVLLQPETIRLFWKNFTPLKKSHRSIGFKLNSSLVTSGGRSIDRKAIGHSGFTGVSIWLEPDGGNQYILLTNRIHPQVKTMPFNRIRRTLHRLLKKAIV